LFISKEKKLNFNEIKMKLHSLVKELKEKNRSIFTKKLVVVKYPQISHTIYLLDYFFFKKEIIFFRAFLQTQQPSLITK
jgi:hypothetical protein